MSHAIPYVPQPEYGEVAEYQLGPLSMLDSNAPQGALRQLVHDQSAIYPETSRKIWVKEPPSVRKGMPVEVIFFQDGGLYLDPDGPVRAGQVLDNLAANGLIPPTAGIFVDPGVYPKRNNSKNRNAEYDAFDARYATFLVDEILPLAVDNSPSLSSLADKWLICGGSSGGNCALTAAWLRPDRFKASISFLSSFPQMPGGNPFPRLAVMNPQRSLRIFMQTAQFDLNHGKPRDNWFAENLKTAAALDLTGHELRLVVGQGGHSPNHGGALLPDALAWASSKAEYDPETTWKG